MKKNFGDKGIIIQYIQQMLYENYNSDVHVDGKYYTTFDMNYGMAHYIAKYLDRTYPMLDETARDEYNHIDDQTRSLYKPITLMNYFLSNNKGNILESNLFPVVQNNEIIDYRINPNSLYGKLYNDYMFKNKESKSRFVNIYDLPLFYTIQEEDELKPEDFNSTIFHLEQWRTDKEIFEIDDFVGSYLLGRTIGPNSSMEDIYYVQKLLIRGRNIEQFEKGVWCPKTDPNGMPCKGTIYDMTQTVIDYQQKIVSQLNKYNVFVTGYFDIFTEAFAIKEFGVRSNGILGL